MARPRRQDRASVHAANVSLKATKVQRDRWKAMAIKQGMTLSQWLRMVLDRAARTG